MQDTGTTRDRRKAGWQIFALAAGILVSLSLLISAVEPLWILLIFLVFGLTLVGVLKFPSAMLVPVIFIPQWKTLSLLEGLQRHMDLTLVALIVLSLVLLIQLTRGFREGWSVQRLFAGEKLGVAVFFLFALIVAASYLYTPAPNWGFTQMTRLWGIGGVLFLSPFILIKKEEDFRQFAITFLCFAIVRGIDTILFPEYAKEETMQDTVKTDIGAAWLIGMAILIVLYYELFEAKRVQWFMKLICLPLLAAGLIAATARGPIFALVLVLLTAPLVSPQKLFRPGAALRWLGLLIIIVIGSWVSFSSLWWAQTRFQQKTREIVEILQGSAPSSGSAVERLDFYKAALTEIAERPIWGLGVGGWAVYYNGKDERAYPHNLLLLVAVEQGMLGESVLVTFLIVVSLAIKRIVKASGEHFIVLFALFAFSVTVSMFSGDLDTNRLLWFWCGMSFAFSRFLKLSPTGSYTSSKEFAAVCTGLRPPHVPHRPTCHAAPWCYARIAIEVWNHGE